jgi:general secretion pathway protein B
MSYILDALRKADAQREGDSARGIHARPFHISPTEDEQRRRYYPWLWAAGMLTLAAVAMAGWYHYRHQDEAAANRAVAAEVLARTNAPVPVMPTAPASAISRPVSVPNNIGRAVPAESSTPAVATAVLPLPDVVTAPPVAEPATRISAPATAVAGLPPDAPKLTIGGGVYSVNRAQRMLIVNGQVYGEGADLGSEVTLDEIRAKSAVFRYRGARYLLGY